jgi:hypothetical protein
MRCELQANCSAILPWQITLWLARRRVMMEAIEAQDFGARPANISALGLQSLAADRRVIQQS